MSDRQLAIHLVDGMLQRQNHLLLEPAIQRIGVGGSGGRVIVGVGLALDQPASAR
jgi:hypothetical protein